MRFILDILIVPLIFINICSTTKAEEFNLDSPLELEPNCARLLLRNGPQLHFLDDNDQNATFSLDDNEHVYTSFGHVIEEFYGDYFITVTLRPNCSVVIYREGSTNGTLIEKSDERFNVYATYGDSVESIWCFCGRSPDMICQSHPECQPDKSNDISEAGHCAHGYQEPFCGSCRSGYLIMTPGNYYSATDPETIQSVVMGRGCHLWNGDRRINTRPTGNVSIDWYKDLFCNCSESGPVDQDYDDFLSDSTTPSINVSTHIFVAFTVTVLIICCISLLYKFHGKICFTRKNRIGIIPAGEIEVLNEVTTGKFGVIRLAQWKSVKCILKSAAQRTVTSTEGGMYTKLLFQELQILRRLKGHSNIVRIYGTVNHFEFSKCIVLEYCENGDLKSYLQKIDNQARFVNVLSLLRERSDRDRELRTSITAWSVHLDQIRYILDTDSDSFSTFTLMKWCMEIATGMEFLGKRSVVHVDLAARNILLTIDKTARIADFGLSKILTRSEQTVQVGLNDEERWLPLGWMGPEGAGTGRFSIKSDVWSFGITLWEIYSLGEDPYKNIPNNELVEKLRNGHRLGLPTYASIVVYEKLLECWKLEPSQRPCFQALTQFFKGEIVLMREALELIINDQVLTPCSTEPTPLEISPYINADEL